VASDEGLVFNTHKVLSFIEPGSKGIEIGVWKGALARRIVQKQPSEYVLIDPWLYQPEFSNTMYGGGIAKCQADMDAIFTAVLKEFGRGFRFCDVRQGMSQDVLPSLPRRYFDWVIVDGNHTYVYTLLDLFLSYNRLRDGGVIIVDNFRGTDVNRACATFKFEMNARVSIVWEYGETIVFRRCEK